MRRRCAWAIMVLCIVAAPVCAATDFTITTPTAGIGAGTPSRAISLTVTGGPVGGTDAVCALTDGAVGGAFYVDALVTSVTIPSGSPVSTVTQFVYVVPPATVTPVVLQAVCTGGIVATHTVIMPITTSTVVVHDTFTGTAATDLTAHAPDTGGSWASYSGGASLLLNGTGGVYVTGSGFSTYFNATAEPIGADYDQTFDVTIQDLANNGLLAGLVQTVGISPTSLNGYLTQINPTVPQWESYRYVSNSGLSLWNVSVPTITTATYRMLYAIRSINGNQHLFAFADDILLNGGPVVNGYLQTGYAGFVAEPQAGGGVDGPLASNYYVRNADWGPPPVVVTFPDAHVYQSPNTWLNSAGTATCFAGGCYVKFGVTGTATITANVNTAVNAGLSTADDMPAIKIHVDTGAQAGPWSFVQFPKNDLLTTPIVLAAGLNPATAYLVTLYMPGGNQAQGNSWTSTASWTQINSLQFDPTATLSAYTPRPHTALFWGDSYLQASFGGAPAGPYYTYIDASLSYPFIVCGQSGLNCEYGQVGIGSQGWVHPGNGGYPAFPATWGSFDSTDAKTLSCPDYAIVAEGINDHSQTDASVTAAVSGWIPAFRAACAATKVFVLLNIAQIKSAAIRAGVTAAADALVYVVDPGTEYQNTVFSSCTASWASPDCLHLTSTYQGILGAAVVRGVVQAAGGGGSGPGSIVIH